MVDASDDDFLAALPDALSAVEVPLYNVHPVARLLLARRVAADGHMALVTGDGADQRCQRRDGHDYLPLVASLTRAAGLTWVSPYLHPSLVELDETTVEKQPLRALLARDLPDVAHAPKKPRLAPALSLPDADRRLVDELAAAEPRSRLMCGLAGELRWDAPPDEARIRRMSAALAHRGPDGEGLLRLEYACLASRRLALRDVRGGAQPMSTPDGRWHLVFNGEIDNADALRRRHAARYAFRTRCDTEVLLAALSIEGEALLPQLDGMFAFCLWDAQRGEALLARDRLGIKPLVFSQQDGFLFASECKALLAAGVRAVADLEALAETMTAAPFSGVVRAPFRGIELLAPGERLRVTRDGVDRKRWWRPRISGDRIDDVVPAMRTLLGEAVRGALVADVPVGLLLSGGLDSTLLAAFAHEAGARPPSYTMAFDDQARFAWSSSRLVVADDEPYAAEAAARCGLLRTLCVGTRDEATIARVAAQDDLVPAWEQEVSQHVLACRASRDVKAVLVGDAADETHYGYHFLLDEAALQGPEAVLPRFGVAPLRRTLLGEARLDFSSRYRTELEAAGHGWGSLDDRRRAMTHLLVTRWLPRLLSNGDLHTMAHGLEARVPFAHPALVELALRVAPSVALHGGMEKAVLRRVADGIVPASIVARRKSALPKDLASEALYRRALPAARRRAPTLFRELFDSAALDTLEQAPWTEADRAVAFRLVALSHWAARYEVRA